MDGQTDRDKTVYPSPPSGSGGIIMFNDFTVHVINTIYMQHKRHVTMYPCDNKQFTSYHQVSFDNLFSIFM